MKYSEKQERGVRGLTSMVKLQEFDSIHEFTNYLDVTPVNRVFTGNRLSSEEFGNSSWAGTSTFPEAIGIFNSGWTTFAQKLTKRIPVTTKSAPVQKSRPAYSVVGGQASVPRYIQGIPTNMIDRRPVIQKQKIIIINKDISYSANVKAEAIQEEGVKAIQIIQALEKKGFRVKLNMCWASQSNSETVGVRITIKKPEERLSLTKIAFPIAHPSMLRRVAFKWLEVFPEMTEKSFTSGYGRPQTAKMKNILDEKEIFLPNFIHDVDKFIEQLGY